MKALVYDKFYKLENGEYVPKIIYAEVLTYYASKDKIRYRHIPLEGEEKSFYPVGDTTEFRLLGYWVDTDKPEHASFKIRLLEFEEWINKLQ